MRRLMLLRHAKSSWESHGMADIDRPLNERGRDAAPRMARQMASMGLNPQIILCSSALRTRETLAFTLPHFSGDAHITLSKLLYFGGEQDYLAMIRALPETATSVLVIGHNPIIENLATQLCGSGNAAARKAITEQYPTGALTIIDFERPWSEIVASAGTLIAFIRPRDLDPVVEEAGSAAAEG